ncbi:MAG: alpha-L-fucosidase [Myxococcota bacterium]|nr:alpha-L-fucosidase [Myxococcota bacterium]
MPSRPYEPTRASLRAHPVPAWYDAAKLGIFIHWSVSSVPAFAPRTSLHEVLTGAGLGASPYSEWYWNSLKIPGSAVADHHREQYGDRPYESFADDYRAGLEQWRPAEWARAFRAAGARYVVLVTKHHDGFCLWPSAVPRRDGRWQGWHTGRDVVGELAAAVRAEGLRFGVYYSGGLDWTFEPRPIEGLLDLFVRMPGGEYPAYADAQVRELVERYAPDVLWNDISWPDAKQALWRLIADYYTAVPEGVINDRWMHRSRALALLRIGPLRSALDALLRRRLAKQEGMASPPPPTVWDYRTPEYARFDRIQRSKWECVRGIDKSFGYNRNSRPEDFLSHEDLLHSFADIVSKNGNLLLNVGPRGEDARIPEIQLERLRWLGAFLADCGEAVFDTKPWTRAEGTTREGVPVRFTQRDGTLYATLLGTPPSSTATFVDVPAVEGDEVRRLGDDRPPRVERLGADLRVEVASDWPERPAHAFRLGRA